MEIEFGEVDELSTTQALLGAVEAIVYGLWTEALEHLDESRLVIRPDGPDAHGLSVAQLYFGVVVSRFHRPQYEGMNHTIGEREISDVALSPGSSRLALDRDDPPDPNLDEGVAVSGPEALDRRVASAV